MTLYAPLCPGCFKDKGEPPVCPHCGYDESEKRSPLVLPHRTLLDRDHYLVGRILGKPGGFGITYLARDVRLDSLVAIKEYLPRDLAARDPGKSTVTPHSKEDQELFQYGMDQFLAEARTLESLDHSNIVRVRNFFEENDTAYLVMDYYSGITLEEYRVRQGGRLSENLAVNIMMPVLDGLREVHATGRLHRDVKPQNIYLTADGRPILLDFGAARFAVGERSRSLSVVLTPGFAPYEQYHRKGKQGVWTDIYACGATLYALLAGVVPPEATERKDKDAIVPLGDAAPGTSSNVRDAVMASLAVDSDARPGDIQTFQKMLTAIPGFDDGEKEAPAVVSKIEPVPAMEPESAPGRATAEGRKRKKGLKAAVLVFILLLLAGVGVWQFYFRPWFESRSTVEERVAEPSMKIDYLNSVESRSTVEERVAEPAIKTYSLTVNAHPEDARVEIVEPEAAYSPGVELEPGRYRLKVSREGYETAREWVDLTSGDLAVQIRLEEIRRRLVIHTRPPDARVRLVGSDVDYYDGVELKPGRYEVEVSREDYRAERFQADLRNGDFTTSVALEELTPEAFTNSLGMTFRLIQPGRFMMGSPESEPERGSDEKRHEVVLTEKFYMQITEVTNEQFVTFLNAVGKRGSEKEPWFETQSEDDDSRILGRIGDFSVESGYGSHPVVEVSWYGAKAMADWLSEREDKSYRLPTEAEWEYAARAGTTTPFTYGRCLSTDQANYDGNYPLDGCAKGEYRKKTVPVGSLNAPNAWGLHDMHGNVWEWCQDWYGDYPSGSVTDPTGPSSGEYRVLRGGGWYDFAGYCRSAYRYWFTADYRYNNSGFRLVLPPGQR